MNYASLRNEIFNGPMAATLAPLVVDYTAPKTPGVAQRDQAIANILNTPQTVGYRSTFVDARGLLAQLNPAVAASILDKLEAVSSSNSIVKWAMYYVTGSGIDVGHPNTRALVQALVAGEVLTSDEGSALIGLSEVQIGRAEAVLGSSVSGADVSIALRGSNEFNPRA